MSVLYRRTQGLYKVGEQIPPGNWGRIIQGFGPNHNRFFPEYLFEKIRREEFADKPSRMSVAFAFENENFAKNWNRSNVPEHVYSVKIADPNCRTHRADMSWIDFVKDYRTFEGVEECARQYWRGDERDPKQIEILVADCLIVQERLPKIPEDGITQNQKIDSGSIR